MENLNWDVISTLSNITLSLLTFIGLMITLYFSLRNTFYKLELTFDTTYDQWQMKVINKRNVPVSIMIYGLSYKNDENRYIALSANHPSKGNNRLEWNDVFRHKVHVVVMNELLLQRGFKEGETVQIYASAKTEDGKIYVKKMRKFVVAKLALVATK